MGNEGDEYRWARRPEHSVLHRAVREGWPLVAAAAAERGGFPKRVHEEVRRYLQCGVLRYGFSVAKCDSCEKSELIAFSCKTRGWCPSCASRRAHETAEHLLTVLPRVAFRQWTLTLPRPLRWPVVKDAKLLRQVERCLVKAIFRRQKRRAKGLGVEGEPTRGAVSFVQLFNSALGLQPHLHVLVPEGVWNTDGFAALPPPDTEDVQAVLARAVRQLARIFGDLAAGWPEDGFEALQAEGAQLRMELRNVEAEEKKNRVAVAEGFSLHAATWVHAHDRNGLARLARYGARGPVAESRLSRRDDGQYVYETKRGITLVLTAEQLVRRLVWLIPPRGLHLTNFHGVFASAAKARAKVMAEPDAEQPEADASKATAKAAPPCDMTKVTATAVANTELEELKRPRLDWAALHARTWRVDVWRCPCGGRRKVLAVVTSPSTAEQMLRNMGLLQLRPPLPMAQSPPQLELGV